MNKIIVVGHPQSGSAEVLRLLIECGMAPALPSRRDNLTPAQISATLVKAHGVVPVEEVQSADQLQQIQVAPVWQGMVLDLMLSNLDQPLWGWADTQAVYLLDYWKEQDPQAVFVLVYDEPQTAYTRLSLGQAAASYDELRRRMDAWTGYNAALLHFHLRNPQRSVLVHGRQVQPSAQSCLQHVSARINVPMLAPAGLQLSLPKNIDAIVAAAEVVSERAPVMQWASLGDMGHAEERGPSAHVDLLANLLMDAHPHASTLYEELQAAATLPSAMAGHRGHIADDAQAIYRAWQACVAQCQLERKHAHSVQALTAQIQTLQTEKQVGVQEGQLLMGQLHEVQEELERRYLEGKQLAQELQALKALEPAVREKTKQLADAQAQIKQLQAACTAAPKQSASTELKQENALLLIQLHKVQEELERIYLENRKSKSNPKPQPKAYYGAAERVKQQLSYRLGSTMIARSRSVGGWLGMPFALHAETRRFRKAMAERKGEKLPPIAQYRDAHEAERIKQHLSYRLGSTLIAGSKSMVGWLCLPQALYAEVRSFQRKRQPSVM